MSPAATAGPPANEPAGTGARRVGLVLLAALLAGVVISFGQTVAPEPISPLFNSATPVVALAGGLALVGRRLWSNIVFGALAGPLAMVGYYVTTALRDYGVSMRMVLFWCAAGMVSGVAMGLAVWLLRGNGSRWLRGVGAAVLPATAVGEAAHGIVRISDTTPILYWSGLGVLGLALLAWLAARRLDGAVERAVAVAATAVFAVVLFLIYGG
ncbi:hypothetical protein FOJ82_08590 [Tessaracoccus rhinocerotis]|uniref:Uncharacterized protein n=1 Tax=Tessaracoccus rhinocerotis TaxID=1689449 RepID=A0A553K067_9ACTN|nr:DUF6518 family protein [Tessaracoccus rhinocerotis]TRY18106.1 hypothetical protein FOJ82_08590 [Tessaracoccus rhinocerotis]